MSPMDEPQRAKHQRLRLQRDDGGPQIKKACRSVTDMRADVERQSALGHKLAVEAGHSARSGIIAVIDIQRPPYCGRSLFGSGMQCLWHLSGRVLFVWNHRSLCAPSVPDDTRNSVIA